MSAPTPTPPTPSPTPLPWYKSPYFTNTVSSIVTAIVLSLVAWAAGGFHGAPPAPVPAPPDWPTSFKGATGWVQPEADETEAAVRAIAAFQGVPAQFSRVGQAAMAGDDNHSQFVFLAEQKVVGSLLPSWDQGPYGECVSFGWGRGSQDCMFVAIASGNGSWPGPQVATEPIYAGSRVEIGQGKIRGDGSTGAWAAQWVQKFGLLFRQQYPGYDLSSYNGSLGRQWGRRGVGVPKSLEDLSKQHPVKTVAQVTTADELWSALGNLYPVPVCSDVGFDGKPGSDGIIAPRGTWGHCMLFRGRYTDPVKGRCVVCQNSWGDYLNGRLTVHTADMGDVQLPEGCFGVTLAVAGRMVAENDSFAISDVQGFPSRKIDWPTLNRPRQRPDAALFAAFSLGL